MRLLPLRNVSFSNRDWSEAARTSSCAAANRRATQLLLVNPYTFSILARDDAVSGLGVRLAVGARQIFGDVFSKFALQRVDRQARIDGDEAELAGEPAVLVDEAALIALE